MVEKNIKEEDESGLEERRAREQLGEGAEVRLESFQKILSSDFSKVPPVTVSLYAVLILPLCSGGADLYGPENR